MTDEKIERVARAICANLGLDPEEIVRHGYGEPMTPAEFRKEAGNTIPMVALHSPRWCIYRALAAEAMAVQKALQEERE